MGSIPDSLGFFFEVRQYFHRREREYVSAEKFLTKFVRRSLMWRGSADGHGPIFETKMQGVYHGLAPRDMRGSEYDYIQEY